MAMAKTGIKIKRCNVGSVEAHNKRSEEYLESVKKSGCKIYIYSDLTPNNTSWENKRYSGKTCQSLFEDMKSLYREKVGQEPQLQDRERTNKKTGKKTIIAGWSPIREGVAPIKENTKIADFAPVVEWARSNGLDVIRIDLHFDEGHDDAKTNERKLNRHAHIVFDWMNHKTGKTIKLDDKKMSELQDVMASALGMERGERKEKTGKEHIPYAEYREMKAAENAAAIEKEAEQAKMERDAARQENIEVQNKTNTLRETNKALTLRKKKIESEIESLDSSLTLIAEGVVKGTAQGVADWITRKSKKRADKAEEEARKYKAYAITKDKEAKEANKRADDAENKAYERISEVNAWESEHQAELSLIEDLKIRASKAEIELKELKDSISLRDTWIEKFIEFGVTLRDQWNKLFNDESVKSNHVYLNGMICPLDNPIQIRKAKFGRVEIYDQHWVTEEGFWNGIRKGLTNAFNSGSDAYIWLLKHLRGGRGMKM